MGITNVRIDAFSRISPTAILLSFDADRTIPILGLIDDSDILRFDGTLGASGPSVRSGVTGADEDLLEFTPTSIGAVTAGTFSLYSDGSDVGLTLAGEDVDAAAVDALGNIYLSTTDLFSVTGISGEGDDVFVFDPTTLGLVTTGTFLPTPYFDGSSFGLTANDVFAIDLP